MTWLCNRSEIDGLKSRQAVGRPVDGRGWTRLICVPHAGRSGRRRRRDPFDHRLDRGCGVGYLGYRKAHALGEGAVLVRPKRIDDNLWRPGVRASNREDLDARLADARKVLVYHEFVEQDQIDQIPEAIVVLPDLGLGARVDLLRDLIGQGQ